MLRFLITDDDDVMRAFLRHVLLGVGDVNHAFSGQEAVEAGDGALAEGTPFDCVFMDAITPGMNGLETASQADRYIVKPFDRRTVLTALAEPGFGQHPVGEKGEDSW
jgi:CheY-like chemotaxis protein